MEPSSTDDNAEPTEEEMRAQMLRMKSNFKSIAAGRPIEAIPPSRALFGSSSLSSLPPSSPPLPPPKPARRSSLSFEKERTEREASPPAVARFSPSPKRVVTTRIVSLLPSSPPRSQASTTESPVPVSRRTQRIIESASGDENSDSDATPKAKPVRPRLSFELADDDQAEDTEMEDREAPALSIPPASGLGDLFDDDDEDIVAQMSLPKSGKLKVRMS
jgi:hypothetical protein